MQLSYPSSTEISYAQWLKHFAAQLPFVANRYDISESEVSAVQALAQDFLGLLIYRINCTTQAIVLQEQLTSVPQFSNDLVGAGMCALLQESIASLVHRIYQHSTYSEADDTLLELSRLLTYSNSISLAFSIDLGDW
jgi:hypothetical protein